MEQGRRLLDLFLDSGGDIAIATIATPAFLCCPSVIQPRALLPNAPEKATALDSMAPLRGRLHISMNH